MNETMDITVELSTETLLLMNLARYCKRGHKIPMRTSTEQTDEIELFDDTENKMDETHRERRTVESIKNTLYTWGRLQYEPWNAISISAWSVYTKDYDLCHVVPSGDGGFKVRREASYFTSSGYICYLNLAFELEKAAVGLDVLQRKFRPFMWNTEGLVDLVLDYLGPYAWQSLLQPSRRMHACYCCAMNSKAFKREAIETDHLAMLGPKLIEHVADSYCAPSIYRSKSADEILEQHEHIEVDVVIRKSKSMQSGKRLHTMGHIGGYKKRQRRV